MAKRIVRCRKHPELEKLIAKYRGGVPVMDGYWCPICKTRETLDAIAEEARKEGLRRSGGNENCRK